MAANTPFHRFLMSAAFLFFLLTAPASIKARPIGISSMNPAETKIQTALVAYSFVYTAVVYCPSI